MTRAGVTEFRHQIHGPTGPIAIYTRRSSGTADTYYLHRDHLGSPELVTNAAGAQVVKLSFGAFGERRGSNWTGPPSSGDWTAIGNTTRDGFTDHEHLDAVGLIHMNGRVYDPKVGRFLSPDPFIDWGLGTQGVNRYGYVGNNPLNRIDPSGFCRDSVTTRTENVCMDGWDISFTFYPGWSITFTFQGNSGGRGFSLSGVSGSGFGGYLGASPPSGGGGGGRGNGSGGGSDAGEEPPAEKGDEPNEPKPLCEGEPQILDPSLTALSASAATIVKNSTGDLVTPMGSRGIDAVTSGRIAPYQQLAANLDWAHISTVAVRASWTVNIVNIGIGFRNSVPDGIHAVVDFGVSVALPFVPWVGIPASIMYGTHGGSKALVNDVKFFAGACVRP